MLGECELYTKKLIKVQIAVSIFYILEMRKLLVTRRDTSDTMEFKSIS